MATIIDLDALAAATENKDPWQPHEREFFPKITAITKRISWFLHHHTIWFVANGQIISKLIALALIVTSALSYDSEPESTGSAPQIAMLLAILLSTRSGLINLIGIPFERALKGHISFGNLALFLSIWHGIHSSWKDSKWHPSEWDFTYWTGWVSTAALALLFLSSRWRIRRYFFEFFLVNHWIWVIASVAAGAIHGAGALAFGIVVIVVDSAFRIFTAKRKSQPKEVTLAALPAEVLSLRFPKGNFKYKAGQYLNVALPELGSAWLHPVSISSGPHQEDVTLHVRALGEWSRKAYQLAQKHSGQKVPAIIEGPYGEPSLDIDGSTYSHFLLFSGGIGITPMQSIAIDLLHQYHRGRPMDKIWFVWSVRDRAMVDALKTNATSELADKDVVAIPIDSALNDLELQEFDEPDVPDLAASPVPPPNEQDELLPQSFQPNFLKALDPEEASAVLKTEFYLTHPDTTPDGVCKTGRPNVERIMNDMAKTAKGARVAVLVCGPKPLVKDVKIFASKHKKFDVHSETFEF